MNFSLDIERHTKEPDEGPQGTESMVIHQDQPRYIGFRPQDDAGNNE